MKLKPNKYFKEGTDYIFSYTLYRKFKKEVDHTINDQLAVELDGNIVNKKDNIPPEFCYQKGDAKIEKIEKAVKKQRNIYENLKL